MLREIDWIVNICLGLPVLTFMAHWRDSGGRQILRTFWSAIAMQVGALELLAQSKPLLLVGGSNGGTVNSIWFACHWVIEQPAN
jgi:hypothetical protein